MLEDFAVMVINGGYGVDIREKKMFKSSLKKIMCAVCPKCGYAETTLILTKKLKSW